MKGKAALFLIITLSLSCVSLESYINKRPEVKLKDLDIKSVSFRDINLLLDMEISNPYPIGIRLEKVSFKVDIENKTVVTTTTPSGLAIESKGTANTPLDVRLEYDKITKVVRDYANKEYLNCQISGDITLPLPKIPGLPQTFTFPFKVDRKIPALKPSFAISGFSIKAPSVADIADAIKRSGKSLDVKKIGGMLGGLVGGKKISIDDVNLAELDLKLGVSFDIVVKNGTRAKLAFNALSYAFMINGENVFQGNSSGAQASGNAMVLKINNQLSTKSLSKSMLDMLKSRKGTFAITGEAGVNFPPDIKKTPLTLKFDEKGSFRL